MKLKYLILFLFIINCTSNSSKSNSYQYKIVCQSDGINIRTGPGTHYSKDSSGQLFKGENIYVLEEKKGWLQFRVTPKDVGWSGWVLKRLVTDEIKSSTSTQKQYKNVNPPLKFEFVNTVSYGYTMTGVKVKITNMSGRDIYNAQVTCIAKNKSGQEIDFKKHYVIKSTEGGLGAGGITYFEYVLDANRNAVDYVNFRLNDINYR